MVYKNLVNTSNFESAAGLFAGSDNVTVELDADEFTFVKTADPIMWSGVDPLTYTITLASAGEDELNDITVTDVLPDGVTFLRDTVQINGAQSTNFNDENLPTVVFGTDTLLAVTIENPLIISFQVEEQA